ncbi:little elongation complex subunit 2 [Scaptodrosophila lebanonensis]|uniref:Little elongation complex subunit 2 n=1 Tax=Drosophila lebanonensis TaxID=7225 RepID=A0A6J2TBU4_DROLE|nr:little elongation complex subunit 2 [Scaptodrosophila lebanonensis]
MDEASTTSSAVLYQGNAVFRNQPSYKIFNKSFEHVDDTLFAFLNDVNHEILKEEVKAPSQIFTCYNCPLEDPRTGKPVINSLHDYAKKKQSVAFPNPQGHYSSLTREQQSACLRVLLAWKRNKPLSENDLVIWQQTETIRSKEQKLVQEYISNYARTQKELLYEPIRRLVSLYRKWYEQQVKLLQQLPNFERSYVTYSGFPQLQQCKSLNNQIADIEHVQLIQRTGEVRLWPVVKVTKQELYTLHIRLERYASVVGAVNTFEDNHNRETEADVFVLPLESLLMLLLAGSYTDLPKEMLLKIHQAEGSDYKCIEFKDPLPARSCGWHTNSAVINQAYRAYSSQPGQAQWVRFADNGSVNVLNDIASLECDDSERHLNLNAEYKLQLCDLNDICTSELKTNSALIKWRLNCANTAYDGQNFIMYTSLEIPAVQDRTANQAVGCHLIKLESKSECGCEIMTKYELLKAWLQLKLLQSNVGLCTRISLHGFTPLLEEQLTVEGLEQQLRECYHINMPQFLCNFYEFLKLLRSVPSGDYVLRYTQKYKDKFLLCKPTVGKTAHSFKLSDLLNETPTDDNFWTDNTSYLPISPTLCSRMHEERNLLPLAFPVQKKGAKPIQQPIAVKVPPKKVQAKTQARINYKKSKKSIYRARRRAAARAEEEQDKALEKFMCL